MRVRGHCINNHLRSCNLIGLQFFCSGTNPDIGVQPDLRSMRGRGSARLSRSCCRSGHRVAGWLREGCHCGRLPSHYRRARTQDYLACWTRTRHDFSLTCHSVQRTRQPLSRRAISVGSFTVAVDFVLKLIRLESLGSELQQS